MNDQTAVKKYSLVKCVTDGDGYEKGGIYPQVGDNNGIHILRETETGDVYDGVFMTGGRGKGLFNPWDNSGCPSFDPYYEGTKQGDQSAKADGGKLKPCPFCGAPANIWSWNGGTRVDCSRWYSDPTATKVHFVGIGAKTAEEAIKAWNERWEEGE